MLYSIEINKPLKDIYGAKIPFRVPSNIKRLKSINLIVNNIVGLDNAAQREATFEDIFDVSVLLNNESDEVIQDANFQTGLFLCNDISVLETLDYTKRNYVNTRILINKDIISNGMNYLTLKLNQGIINYYNANSYLNFEHFLRTKLTLTLYLESE